MEYIMEFWPVESQIKDNKNSFLTNKNVNIVLPSGNGTYWYQQFHSYKLQYPIDFHSKSIADICNSILTCYYSKTTYPWCRFY